MTEQSKQADWPTPEKEDMVIRSAVDPYGRPIGSMERVRATINTMRDDYGNILPKTQDAADKASLASIDIGHYELMRMGRDTSPTPDLAHNKLTKSGDFARARGASKAYLRDDSVLRPE